MGDPSSAWRAIATTAAIVAVASGPPLRVRVAFAPAAVVDGRLSGGEWESAKRERLPAGASIRLQHDGRYLFLGIESSRPGFASVCLADGDTVRILHASAALGSVTYVRGASGWTTRDTEFAFGMRNPDLTDPACAERTEYLSRHGWVASTFRMGEGKVQELQVALAGLGKAPRVSAAFFVPAEDSGSIVTWPESLATGDGCADESLVRGHVPPTLRFSPEHWAELELEQVPGHSARPSKAEALTVAAWHEFVNDNAFDGAAKDGRRGWPWQAVPASRR